VDDPAFPERRLVLRTPRKQQFAPTRFVDIERIRAIGGAAEGPEWGKPCRPSIDMVAAAKRPSTVTRIGRRDDGPCRKKDLHRRQESPWIDRRTN
jgi:hypothetical protein